MIVRGSCEMQLVLLFFFVVAGEQALGASTADGKVGADVGDLKRARQKVPRDEFRGDSFAKMAEVLTNHLRKGGLRVEKCEDWSVFALQDLQRTLYKEADPELWATYAVSHDGRRQRFQSMEALEKHWAHLDRAMLKLSEMGVKAWEVRRDGLCHEAVMWAVHHLPAANLKELQKLNSPLPSLPAQRHVLASLVSAADNSSSSSERNLVYSEYEHQVSCQQCHTGRIADPSWQSAVLPKPLPLDKVHPGRERQRSCDYQNVPPCGPCEGLGGPRWGDDPEEMTPMQCEILSGPEVPPRTHGRYPPLAMARVTGGTRIPLEVRPTQKGRYIKMDANLTLGWKDKVMRMRYDFGGQGSQISAQSFEMAERQDVGATIGIAGGRCTCDASIAGNMHIQAFEPDDPFDFVKLKPSEGGASYLGRVRVVLDGDTPSTNGTIAIADHYMKWAFHFLVDADEASASFGLPLRLYGATGVRQVFDSWTLGDPEIDRPSVWTLPAGCNVTSSACSVFKTSAPALVI
eukprot:TRINITY_DN58531_c0_g1_i1.p1 TRINITY_DN58531_c0_g1~~TRINITY_DN58531_c0_g1_i1.p1  ORF type:complete len:517 (-),score=68.17 TRINITY_DN58531_c0_g1_i1:137-1687(-)